MCLLLLLAAVSCGGKRPAAPSAVAPAAQQQGIAVPSPSSELIQQTAAPAATAQPTDSEIEAPHKTRTPRTSDASGQSGGRSSRSGGVSASVPSLAGAVNGVAPAGRSCPPAAPIKGTRAHVYHTPASRTYETVVPIVCFVSTSDASQSGYRPSSQ